MITTTAAAAAPAPAPITCGPCREMAKSLLKSENEVRIDRRHIYSVGSSEPVCVNVW